MFRILYRESGRPVSEVKVRKLLIGDLLIVEFSEYLVHQLLFGLCIV